MNKFLEKNERDFNVCSDCIYFKFYQLIDQNYPKICRGKCTLLNKLVDNRWETKCKHCTANFTCKSCIYYYNDMCDLFCKNISKQLKQYFEKDKNICNQFQHI